MERLSRESIHFAAKGSGVTADFIRTTQEQGILEERMRIMKENPDITPAEAHARATQALLKREQATTDATAARQAEAERLAGNNINGASVFGFGL